MDDKIRLCRTNSDNDNNKTSYTHFESPDDQVEKVGFDKIYYGGQGEHIALDKNKGQI